MKAVASLVLDPINPASHLAATNRIAWSVLPRDTPRDLWRQASCVPVAARWRPVSAAASDIGLSAVPSGNPHVPGAMTAVI